jgi:FkbM family methyltransferase
MNLDGLIGKSYLHEFLQHAKGKEWICFGASDAGATAPQYLLKEGIKIKYYCDNDSKKQGSTFHDLQVHSPEYIKRENSPNVLITSCYITEIKKQLSEMGVTNSYAFPGIGNPHGIHDLYDGTVIENNFDQIKKLEAILADETSKIVLEKILKNRLSGESSYLDEIMTGDMYFPQDIIQLGKSENFIDAGGYIGDTAELILSKTGRKYESIHVFEPDPNNFEKLTGNVGNHKNIFCVNKGVADFTGDLSFSVNIGLDSKIDALGKHKIEVVTIDEFFKDRSVSFIKMDIEGGEISALHGAKRIIAQQKPQLAICVYHRPEHLWQIPLTIHSFAPMMNIFLRHHAGSCVDTVCYAI